MYEDEKGVVVSHQWQGKFVIHSELYNGDMSLSNLKHAKKISDAITEAFKTKGVKSLYTWSETEEQERYNKYLGYVPTGRTVEDSFVDSDYPKKVKEFRKEL